MMQRLNDFGFIDGVHVTEIPLEEDFIVLARRFAHMPGTVLLMSGGDLDCARYHILGVRPWLTYTGRYRDLVLETDTGRHEIEGDPFDTLNAILSAFFCDTASPELPISAGLMGYLAYDLKDVIETLPRTSVDDLMLPHIYLVAPSVLFIQDKLTQTTWRAIPRRNGQDMAEIQHWLADRLSGDAPDKQGFCGDARGFQANFSRDLYMDAVARIKEYIAAGHVYQVNMSQRFQMGFSGDAFGFFETLYSMNPAPFFAYVNAGDHHIISTSPERFLHRNGPDVETRPIKGTRPRGATESEDVRQAENLAASPKDDAELSMIVDLLRNDIGKVCEAGSVRVSAHKRLEAYQNVWHLVSIVTGTLDDDQTSADLIRAAFPGGSITGCPKIRSMEIIDELEPTRRHIYTGAIGYIGFHDTLDLNIAIRTATVLNGKVIFSVGGGIVHDSDPADEYDETLHKGQTLMTVFKGADACAVPETVVWMNGAFKKISKATVPAFIPGFEYGDGFFETFRAQHGETPHLAGHLDRFLRTWRCLWKTPAPEVTWRDIIRELLHRNHLNDGMAAVKLIACKGTRDMAPFDTVLIIRVRPYRHRLAGRLEAGIRLATYPWPRQTPLADHKTLNYLFYQRAGEWAKAGGADEAMILNPDGTISETNTANLVLIQNHRAVFPESPHVLPGVTQQMVRRFLEAKGIAVHRMPVAAESLHEYDQILLTNGLMGVVPVSELDGRPLPTPTDVWRTLDSALWSPSFPND